MLFNSMIFLWIFLPISIILYFIVNPKYQSLILLILSLIFYARGNPKYIVILIFSILFNYIFVIIIDKLDKRRKIGKLIFIVAILANLSILFYFKYYNFLVDNLNRIIGRNVIAHMTRSLPLGISFYTFSAISYIADVYKKETKAQKNIINLGLYIAFFPKLLMGPIERYIDFQKILEEKNISIENFANGFKRFIYGLSKKVLIANVVATIADFAFKSSALTLSSRIAWLGAIDYTLQIYFVFSGYSDMAIGLAKMFGYKLNENFDYPYLSQSISEFWRRWHITLSNWFKHYIYFPLGGNRKGKYRTYFNLFIVFLVTGIWHGSSWNFIIWGLFNGFFVIIERMKLGELLNKNKFKILNNIYAMFVIIIGWVLFRAPGIKEALKYLKTMFSFNNLQMDIYNIITKKNITMFIVGILTCGIIQLIYRKISDKSKIKKFIMFSEPLYVLILGIFCILNLVSGTYNSFIYMQF